MDRVVASLSIFGRAAKKCRHHRSAGKADSNWTITTLLESRGGRFVGAIAEYRWVYRSTAQLRHCPFAVRHRTADRYFEKTLANESPVRRPAWLRTNRAG